MRRLSCLTFCAWSALLLYAALTQDSTAATDAQTRARDDTEVMDLRKQLEQMKHAVQALESRLQALEAPTAPVTAPMPRADVTSGPGRATVSGTATGAPRPDNRPTPEDAALRGFIVLPDSKTRIRLGGYLKVDAVYDEEPVAPTGSAALPKEGRFELGARSTRLHLEARSDTVLGPLKFYLEHDFDDGGQTNYHLRQVYGQLGNAYAGFGPSLFEDADAEPDTLDSARSSISGRRTALRYTWKAHSSAYITASLEEPKAEITGAAVVSRQPDIVLAGRIEPTWGHVQLGGVVRRIQARNAGGEHGTGISLSGSVRLGESETLYFTGVTGRGIAHFLGEIAGGGFDAVVGEDGELRALGTGGGFMGVTHRWNPHWRSNLAWSALVLDADTRLPGSAFRTARYGVANLLWQPVPQWLLGLELLQGTRESQDGRSNEATRLHGAIKFVF